MDGLLIDDSHYTFVLTPFIGVSVTQTKGKERYWFGGWVFFPRKDLKKKKELST
jgi:hypothetical protein